jgi:cell division protein FtsN
LGLSSNSEEKFGLAASLNEGVTAIETSEEVTAEASQSPNQPHKVNRRLPQGFVFLDINGNPMQQEIYQSSQPSDTANAATLHTKAEAGKNWFVQAASFRTEDSAQELVELIKSKSIVPQVNIIKKGEWYVVRFPPSDLDTAEHQKKLLYNLLRVRGKIQKIK